MADQKRYFQLDDKVGLNHLTGKPDPIAEIGLVVAVPRMVRGKVEHEVRPLRVKQLSDKELADLKTKPVGRILPGTRVVETASQKVADGLLQRGDFAEIDPPEAKALDEHRKAIAANVAEAEAELETHKEDQDG